MLQVTPDLVWAIVRDNHAFIMKRPNCRTFSKESFNLKNIHSKKYNGFIPRRVLDITSNSTNKGITVAHKTADHQFEPAFNYKKHAQRQSNRRAFRYVRNLTRGLKCRKDLEMTALARASTLLRVQNRINGKVYKRPFLRNIEKWKRQDSKLARRNENRPARTPKEKKPKEKKPKATKAATKPANK